MTFYHWCLMTLGGAIIATWIIGSALAPLIAPYAPGFDFLPFAQPGSPAADGGTHWLGTDQFGRDVLSRGIWALRGDSLLLLVLLPTLYMIALPIALVASSEIPAVSTFARGIGAVCRAVPPVVTYVVLIVSSLFIDLSTTAILALALALASLPNLQDACTLWRECRDSDTLSEPSRGALAAWFAVDVLRRGAICLAVAETLAFFGIGPLGPPQFLVGDMIGETKLMVFVFPHMVFAPVLLICCLLLGLNLLAAGFEGMVPTALAKHDPARPSFREGRL